MISFALITCLAFAPPTDKADSASAPEAEGSSETVSASDSASASETSSETQTVSTEETVSESTSSTSAAGPGEDGAPAETSTTSESSATNTESITVTGPATEAPAPAPDPSAPPPAPGPPPGGVEAVGGAQTAPLPPPPAPINPARIQNGPWRGKGWIAVKVSVTGPLGTGPGPYANPTVLSWGGVLEGGWRMNNLFAVGTAISRQPHQQRRSVVRDPFDELEYTTVYTGRLMSFDLLFFRGYVPVFGRVQPYIDVGGGIGLLTPPLPQDPSRAAGLGRASVGLDIWLARNFTINASVLYRFIGAGGADIGHSLSGHAGVGIHF